MKYRFPTSYCCATCLLMMSNRTIQRMRGMRSWPDFIVQTNPSDVVNAIARIKRTTIDNSIRVDQLETLERDYPGNPAVAMELAQLHFDMGNGSRSFESLQRAADHDRVRLGHIARSTEAERGPVAAARRQVDPNDWPSGYSAEIRIRASRALVSLLDRSRASTLTTGGREAAELPRCATTSLSLVQGVHQSSPEKRERCLFAGHSSSAARTKIGQSSPRARLVQGHVGCRKVAGLLICGFPRSGMEGLGRETWPRGKEEVQPAAALKRSEFGPVLRPWPIAAH